MRRLTMSTNEIRSIFRVGRCFVDQHRDELGGVKRGAYVVFPVTKVAEYFGCDKDEVAAAIEALEARR